MESAYWAWISSHIPILCEEWDWVGWMIFIGFIKVKVLSIVGVHTKWRFNGGIGWDGVGLGGMNERQCFFVCKIWYSRKCSFGPHFESGSACVFHRFPFFWIWWDEWLILNGRRKVKGLHRKLRLYDSIQRSIQNLNTFNNLEILWKYYGIIIVECHRTNTNANIN